MKLLIPLFFLLSACATITTRDENHVGWHCHFDDWCGENQ